MLALTRLLWPEIPVESRSEHSPNRVVIDYVMARRLPPVLGTLESVTRASRHIRHGNFHVQRRTRLMWSSRNRWPANITTLGFPVENKMQVTGGSSGESHRQIIFVVRFPKECA